MTSQVLRNIIQSRCGGRVERCHVIPHLGSYSNASHSWGVAMLMHYLWPKDFPRLAIYCLSHDIPEAWTGDIPAPVAWAVPELKEALGTEDVAVVIDANHMCVASRGVNDVNSSTIPSSFNGKFLNEAVRSELLKHIYSK